MAAIGSALRCGNGPHTVQLQACLSPCELLASCVHVPAKRAPLKGRPSLAAPVSKCNAPSESCEVTKDGRISRRAAAGLLAAIFSAESLCSPAFSSTPNSSKRKNLSIEEIKEIISNDISDGQYFVTGHLSENIYRDDCRFRDPTNDTTGLDKYLQALTILFDPKYSKQELLSIAITSPTTIEAKWTLGGYLKFPWRPRVETFEGSTRYTVDEEGLITLHDESWSISPFTALVETFTPTFGAS